jgi:hypothetical protein
MSQLSTTTVRDLRRSNRSRALWQVFLNGPKADLGQDAVALGGATLPIARLLDSGGARAGQAAGRLRPKRAAGYGPAVAGP